MVMALRFTGQPGPIRAVHCWLNVVSPGNAGVSTETMGVMSHRATNER